MLSLPILKEESPTPRHNEGLTLSPPYFLGEASGAGGSGLAAGSVGAGASGGLASSVAAGFSGALGLHATPIVAKLTSKTRASRGKTHFFIQLHLLSEWSGPPPFFFTR